jgi:hypothetical protein
MNVLIPHFFSSEDIALLMNDPAIAFHKEKPGQVHFSITIPDSIQAKLNMNVSTVPMTWVRGDTVEHVDQGESPFDHTYVIYLTDSPGQFLVDGQSYPIEAGAAHLFSRLPHSTLHAEERLIMGPMSEKGLPVGIPTTVIVYVPTDTFEAYIVYESYTLQATILNIPPPLPETTEDYLVYYFNETGSDNVWNPPPGKKFGGWKLLDFPDNVPIGDNSVDKIYMPGEIYAYTTTTLLTPNWIDVTKRFGLHFNDNTVFYKQNSLSTGSGGVRNYRAKQRKT